MRAADEPTVMLAFLRGLMRRCPRCGQGKLFFALLVGWMVATGGRVRWVPLILASTAVVIVVPLLFYPFAKTLWAALDYLIYRSDPNYSGSEGSQGTSGKRKQIGVGPVGSAEPSYLGIRTDRASSPIRSVIASSGGYSCAV